MSSLPPYAPADFPVVGIGASAGGLEACIKLVAALPNLDGMALIFVLHLDPTHESMMADLLAEHTSMSVLQVTQGMPVEPNRLYVIPPGQYLSVDNGVLHLSQPLARRGARLPFDFLLNSLAEEYGARAVCVILSGSGADGTLGLRSIKGRGGLVIAQDPAEASYDGMPRSAIMTGQVDLVLPAANIPDAITGYARHGAAASAQKGRRAQDRHEEIVGLLRTQTAYDFTLYKQGTLQRRIERRMALAGIAKDDLDRYLEILRGNASERDALANDLLINVTNFFRDPKVFEILGEDIIPNLVSNHSSESPLRIWIAGCSTGEETYSLVMLFREAIESAGAKIRLQVFASDIDSDAVAQAREGLYPKSIGADVSPERLDKFFSAEDRGYKVLPALRETVIFTVHDVLRDPPFSRLDLISCRNLLIYLGREAQERALSIFHFALREGGILLLGNAEAASEAEARFSVISKSARIYRSFGRTRSGKTGTLKSAGGYAQLPTRPAEDRAFHAQAALAELCRKSVLEQYAPAAVLIDRKYRCLYSLGPTDRYLRVASGTAVHDLLSMAREGLRTKIRSAVQRAIQENARIVVGGARATRNGDSVSFSIAVQPLRNDGENLLLICFIDEPKQERRPNSLPEPRDVPRIAELQQELELMRTELESAIHSLEISEQEQKTIYDDALSVNEEFQLMNEELLTSKEELQSVNEELTALNSQLHETLERQRKTFDDLQNVLQSTDVATLFLDTDLKIRFFTQATKSPFHAIPGDIGRPLSDLSLLAADRDLVANARTVLQTHVTIEKEIEAEGGQWYTRRILPYSTADNAVKGVVITFVDVSERKRAADALEEARRKAQFANAAKSHVLAAASHDLRQPLQTLSLLQGMLARVAEGDRARIMVEQLEETLSAMSGMLNTLLETSQIEAGTIHAEVINFPIADLFDLLRDEFALLAREKGLALRVVPCGLSIRSDPHLLELMLRNLLANAVKYTPRGRVLLGCRRREEMLSIEIWDTGVGIPADQLDHIFEEYHQLDDTGRRDTGIGLGLSIVKRLGNLLDHRLRVRSRPGDGSVFAVEVPFQSGERGSRSRSGSSAGGNRTPAEDDGRRGAILVIEDDSQVRHLLEALLRDEGHHTIAVSDGIGARELLSKASFRPDLILADYNLPNGMDGLDVTAMLRERFHSPIPAIILTGDISTNASKEIARRNCAHLKKPVKPNELMRVIQRLLGKTHHAALPQAPRHAGAVGGPPTPVIFIVDDDKRLRQTLQTVFEESGHDVETYSSAEAFLRNYKNGREGCLLVDAYLPGMSGLELLQRLKDTGDRLPSIMITGKSDVSMAVQAMKAGAVDFIEKPVGRGTLLASVVLALERSKDARKLMAWHEAAANRIARLTRRQREIMELVVMGHANKQIAATLGISQRTVEKHRAAIMKTTQSKSIAALARLTVFAALKPGEPGASREQQVNTIPAA